MNRTEQNRIEQVDGQIRHSEALAEESTTTRKEMLRANARCKSFFSPFPLSFSLNSRRAFTLAEVLITLGIIGVVAAMTIPTLVNNYQKTQYVTQLKKAYTEINQGLQQMAFDSGCPGSLKCMSEFDGSNTDSTPLVGALLAKYFKILKNCESNANLGCMSNNIIPNIDGSGTPQNKDSGWDYKFITADGFGVLINSYGNSCSRTDGYSYVGNLAGGACGDMFIDVNGPLKLPNTIGKDIYRFWITDGKGPLIYPRGGQDATSALYWKTSGGCGQFGNKDGEKCAARIIEEGWQMNY